MINVKNLSLALAGQSTLKDISFSIGDKETCYVLGANGSGKTSLVNCIAGIYTEYGGEISFGKKQNWSFVPAVLDKNIHYSVFDFVLMGINRELSYFQLPTTQYKERAKKIIDKFSLTPLIDRKMSELSSGQAKMAYLARGEMEGGHNIIIDEPDAHLDYRGKYEFLASVKKHVNAEQKTGLITVHDPNLAMHFADRVLFIDGGALIENVSKNRRDFNVRFAAALKKIYGPKAELKNGFITYEK